MKAIKLVWKKWLKVAQAIGNFQAQVILSLFYLLIMAPVAVLFRLFADPLRLRRRGARTNFVDWEHPKEDLEQARKPY